MCAAAMHVLSRMTRTVKVNPNPKTFLYFFPLVQSSRAPCCADIFRLKCSCIYKQLQNNVCKREGLHSTSKI